jgi:two-component system, cell cycle response regulator
VLPFRAIVSDWEGKKTAVEFTLPIETARRVRSEASSRACAVVLSGARVGHQVVFGDQLVEIGRSERCALQLDVPSVSRLHAHIEWDGSHHVLCDEGSTNGTFLGEEQIQRATLRDGDRFQVGRVLLKYMAGDNVEVQYHEELRRLALYDALTGAANKAHFTDRLREAVAKARTNAVDITVLALDLDHFKRVNDTHGHQAGDAVLRHAATTIGREVDEGLLFGRVGGEEFAVLGVGVGHAAGLRLGERIRAALASAPVIWSGIEIPVTVSVGVAVRAAASDETAEGLFGRADAQLYAAKSDGRNCVR